MNPATSNGTVKFQTNIPEVVALEFAIGKAVTSQFGGDQVMFSLTDGRRMYLPPFVADKIHNAGISPRTPFQICKREVTHGNRRSVEYQIETPNDDAAGRVPDVPTAAAVTTVPTSATTKTLQPATHVSAPPTIEGNALAVLAISGRAAIDAVLGVEDYARQRGLTDFAFGAENVQKLWVTLFLELSRRGARS